eukprot:gnl/TRDRNA2_/TRDRNA2_80426_c0_seq1.p1 gnl/TRDRNA2_/TRDRNA2_80426_c0~~gnl/TRDRNA2_/TRDRNA2_80426_c0_seq1.p1  ORF type:complete len:234 (-),score=40.33 gnl/TRDRNA2_/TRDRNA2_80426_c0_seq1:96-797(-)
MVPSLFIELSGGIFARPVHDLPVQTWHLHRAVLDRSVLAKRPPALPRCVYEPHVANMRRLRGKRRHPGRDRNRTLAKQARESLVPTEPPPLVWSTKPEDQRGRRRRSVPGDAKLLAERREATNRTTKVDVTAEMAQAAEAEMKMWVEAQNVTWEDRREAAKQKRRAERAAAKAKRAEERLAEKEAAKAAEEAAGEEGKAKKQAAEAAAACEREMYASMWKPPSDHDAILRPKQ